MHTVNIIFIFFSRRGDEIHHPFIMTAGILTICLYSVFTGLDIINHHFYLYAFAQSHNSSNEINNPFTLLNESSPVPTNREMILIDEINALKTDIENTKKASSSGDFETVYNKTLEMATGPNWGNISADLLYRKEIVPLNNFLISLESLNSLSKNTTQRTQTLNDTIIRESNELVTNYGKVIDALAVPIFFVSKIITNLVIPAIIIVIIILAIPKIRRKYRIQY